MTSPPVDRLTVLQSDGNPNNFTGIAFVQVTRPENENQPGPCKPFILRVYFHTDIDLLINKLDDSTIGLMPASIVIHDADGDPMIPNVPVLVILDPPTPALVFQVDKDVCLSYLEFQVDGPHDFRKYRLRIDDPWTKNPANTSGFSRIDRFFNDVPFSFEVGCDDRLDCAPAPFECPVEPPVDFPVDYLARDYVSLKNALLDFAAHRYPEWTFPIEADVGLMLAEIFAALGDEFSYIQDRYARESFLETATERRTLRKKARLLDYDIHDGRTATVLLDVLVTEGDAGNINRGAQAWALTDRAEPIIFEVGLGLRDTRLNYPVNSAWNLGAMQPYWLDGSKQCLEIGATDVLVFGLVADADQLQAGLEIGNRLMLLRTDPEDPSIPSRRHFVHITGISSFVDPLTSQRISRITWDKSDALPFQIDQLLLKLSLNIVPATAGETRSELVFVCHPGPANDPSLPAAVEREGFLPLQLDPAVPAQRSTVFLFSLPDTDTGGLGFLGPSLRESLPEVVLADAIGSEWQFTRSLLEADAQDEAFTLEDGTWRRIIAFRRIGEDIVHNDYASGAGYTLRFGDGVFGRLPPAGTEFTVTYRLNPGVLANVSADTIVKPDDILIPDAERRLPSIVQSVTNPWPVRDGVDPESASNIKLLTPQAYKVDLFFAVTPDDYGVQAARLPFVQRGFGKFRWTGSWSTVFASADPFDAFTLTSPQKTELEGWLDCVRQAGRDVIVKDPKFRTLDLEITICIQPFAYAGQVARLVIEALMGRGGTRPIKGFFNPDNFTFGMPLRRSALEATIQEIPGVRAVLGMRVRSRGRFVFEDFSTLTIVVDPDEVIRLENDPSHPERGSLRILTEGGA